MLECHMLSHMESDTVVAEMDGNAEVMAAVEDGAVEQFVLADVTRDGAHVTLPLADAVSLSDWR